MKLRFIFCLFLLILLGKSSQGQEIHIADSLKMVLSNTNLNKQEQAKINLEISKNSLSTEGIYYAEKSLDLFNQLEDSTYMCLALEEISAHHRKMGNTLDAIEDLLKALSINEKLNKKKNIAVLAAQIGTLYLNDKDTETGLKYMQKGYETLSELKDTMHMALACINIGEAYRMIDSLGTAEQYFNKSIQFNQRLKNVIIEGYCTGNLGLVHSAQNKFEQAKEELQKSVNILEQLQDYYSVSVYLSEKGEILIKEGKKNEGEALLLKSLKMAKEQRIKDQICEISKRLSVFFENKQNFKTALQYRKQYETYHDSLVNIDNVRKIEQLQAQYQIAKKQSDIDILEHNNKQKKKTVYILAISSLILIILLFLLFRVWLEKRKAYNILKDQKVIIEKREQEKSLLLSELNHRVKNNLQMVSSLLSLQAYELKDHPAAEALKISKCRVEALTLIHQKLYTNNLSKSIILDEYVEELTKSLIYNFRKKIDLQLFVDKIVIPFEQAIPIGLIINELVTNSLKYAFTNVAQPVLELKIQEAKDEIILIIKDNGSGIENFDCEKAQSLGIKLVKSLIEQLKGIYKQNNQNGCIWEIKLKPKNNIR